MSSNWVFGDDSVVIHTLPYTCVLSQESASEHTQSSHHHHPVDILDSDSPARPAPLHAHPSLLTTEIQRSSSSEPTPVWHLLPRRGHSALHSGIASLATNNREVILIAWPGDLQTKPSKESEKQTLEIGDLSQDEKTTLEQGLWELGAPNEGKEEGVRCLPVWFGDKTWRDFYDGYCKQYLWPTFHYLSLSDSLDSYEEARYWKAYYDSNLAYAKRIAETYRPGDMIIIHDYHLLLVPKLLRDILGNDALIQLFLHSPFPSSELFRCLPRREQILEGMLGANLCSFQTYSYGRHFLSSCVRVLGYEAAQGGGVDAKGNITRIGTCPIGIDAEKIEEDLLSPGVKPKLESLLKLYQGKKIVVGRDKLDPTKGVIPKLQAFEHLLAAYPQWIGKVVMIQVTSPSPTDSPQLHRKISEMVDHINGTYGTLHFQPLHHYHQTIERDEYFALLTAADVALITAVRDGMNTTSMEYTVCQKESKNPLILSEFVGVVGSLKAALKINPWDRGGCARAIDYCLNMDPEEKAQRHAQLLRRVKSQTAAVWAHSLLFKLMECAGEMQASKETPMLDSAAMLHSYKNAPKRLLMFDYDGTLTPIVKIPSAAVPSPLLLDSLERLASNPNNVVYIISGRDAAFLDLHLGHIPNIGLSAEHGCFIKLPGAKEWSNLTADIDMGWKQDVEDIFRYYEARTSGSMVEKKASSVTFHYRNADPVYGDFQAKECQAMLESMQDKLPIDVLVGKKNVEVRPAHTDKGEIVKRLLYLNPDASFVVCAGDDRTDEDMFRAIHTVKNSALPGEKPIIQPPASVIMYPSTSRRSSRRPSQAPSRASLINPVHSDAGGLLSTLSSKLPTFNGAATGEENEEEEFGPAVSEMHPESTFTIAIDPKMTRNTIASWHVDTPEDLIQLLAKMSLL